jgi:UDP-N-acetyl-D-glucosamine dehydrogenase
MSQVVEQPSAHERRAARSSRVAVVGLGYVGLPLALTFCRRGMGAVGIDVDPAKAQAIGEGRAYLRHVDSAAIAEAVRAGQLTATTDFEQVEECDAVLICVPTPLTPHREPDLSFVERAARAIAPFLRPGQLVSLESTTYPGTTDEVLRPIMEMGSGLVAGRDFYLAYSAERESPGSGTPTHTVPKVVAGHTPRCLEAALDLYRRAFDRVVPASSTRVAEMSKLLENVFRSVNIALVNEMKMLCDRMGLDVWEVLDAAATKPFGFMPFEPGPGLGGHCIPIDPFYLTWKARQYEFRTRFIELAGEINTSMPQYVVQRTIEALNDRGTPLRGAHVLVLGIAYKRDVDDMRESPALALLPALLAAGAAEIRAFDPEGMAEAKKLMPDLVYCENAYETMRGADALVLVTEWNEFRALDLARVKALLKSPPTVVDLRNIYTPEAMRAAGFRYTSVGRAPVEPAEAASERRRQTLKLA